MEYTIIYDLVRSIPRGRVTTYGAIGKALGVSPRVVGWALNTCHKHHNDIPAHRVVNRLGMLTGKFHFKTPQTMEMLLQKENIDIRKNTVVDFERVFWDPILAL